MQNVFKLLQDIFGYCFLFSLLGLFIGLISPKLVIWWGSEKTRSRVLLIYGLATFAFWMLFAGVTIPDVIRRSYHSSCYIVKQNLVTIRTSQEIPSTITMIAKKGEKFKKIYEQDKWVQVKLPNGKTGWIYKEERKLPSSKVKIYVKGSMVNIRDGPSTDYQIIRKVRRGEQLELLGQYRTWYQVRLRDKKLGWIYKPLTLSEKSWKVQLRRQAEEQRKRDMALLKKLITEREGLQKRIDQNKDRIQKWVNMPGKPTPEDAEWLDRIIRENVRLNAKIAKINEDIRAIEQKYFSSKIEFLKFCATHVVEEYIKGKLLTPNTAKFCWSGFLSLPGTFVSYEGNWVFLVKGWVDVENAFGVKIRHHFIVRLRYKEKEGWQLLDFGWL